MLAVLERWADSTHGYFEVMVDDGRRFVLRHQPTLRCWELAAVFAATPRKPAPKPPKPVTTAAPRKFFFSLLHK
ncbi:MAG TPA: hypothetical protein VFJ70_24105 [Burkholderiales bacterium]|nr:hypothetical protein [Burkholderiales bacterium]